MDIILRNKKILVTGAGKGIGRTICKQLADCGAETYALSRTKADLDSLKTEVPSLHVICVDLSDWDKTREEIERIGPLDCLVNNAAIYLFKPFLDTPKADIDRMTEVNFKAAFNVAQVVSKGMVVHGRGGSIVNISSSSTTTALHNFSAYSANKAALDTLTRCMALELGPKKIRVNAVNPALVWTPLNLKHIKGTEHERMVLERTPLGRIAEVDDVVNVVLFLLSGKSAMITGQNIIVDGGYGLQ